MREKILRQNIVYTQQYITQSLHLINKQGPEVAFLSLLPFVIKTNYFTGIKVIANPPPSTRLNVLEVFLSTSICSISTAVGLFL